MKATTGVLAALVALGEGLSGVAMPADLGVLLARFAFACQTDARAVLDAGGNVDRQRALARHAAGAAATLARVLDRHAPAAAGGTGALDGEESLLGANAPMAGAFGRRNNCWPRSMRLCTVPLPWVE